MKVSKIKYEVWKLVGKYWLAASNGMFFETPEEAKEFATKQEKKTGDQHKAVKITLESI